MAVENNKTATKNGNLLWATDNGEKQQTNNPMRPARGARGALERTELREGVMSALAGYLSGKNPRMRNKGITDGVSKRKRSRRRPVRSCNIRGRLTRQQNQG